MGQIGFIPDFPVADSAAIAGDRVADIGAPQPEVRHGAAVVQPVGPSVAQSGVGGLPPAGAEPETGLKLHAGIGVQIDHPVIERVVPGPFFRLDLTPARRGADHFGSGQRAGQHFQLLIPEPPAFGVRADAEEESRRPPRRGTGGRHARETGPAGEAFRGLLPRRGETVVDIVDPVARKRRGIDRNAYRLARRQFNLPLEPAAFTEIIGNGECAVKSEPPLRTIGQHEVRGAACARQHQVERVARVRRDRDGGGRFPVLPQLKTFQPQLKGVAASADPHRFEPEWGRDSGQGVDRAVFARSKDNRRQLPQLSRIVVNAQAYRRLAAVQRAV